MHLAIVSRQIGNYHDARYRALAPSLDRVTVVAAISKGDFAEFTARDRGQYDVVSMFSDRTNYGAAVAQGQIGRATDMIFEALRPDAIAVAGWTNPECAAAIRWGRTQGVPLILMSETQGDDAVRSILREAIKSRIVSLCDAALVGGSSQAAYVEQLGIARSRIHFGYNAVDNSHFAVGAEAARASEQYLRTLHGLPERYILASARFIRKKNLPTLVKAYAKAVATTPGEKPDLVILGDGEMRPALVEATHEVPGRVHLPGYRGYDALPAYYGLAEAFVHVSTVEQWGLVVNEAMAAGTPVIVSEPCGSGRALVSDGVSGLVVYPYRESIAQGLARLFRMTPVERAIMGNEGAKAVADWGPARFASGMSAAIRSSADARRRSGLALWDKAILRRMEKTQVARVV